MAAIPREMRPKGRGPTWREIIYMVARYSPQLQFTTQFPIFFGIALLSIVGNGGIC